MEDAFPLRGRLLNSSDVQVDFVDAKDRYPIRSIKPHGSQMINTTKIRNFLSHHPRKSEKVSYQVYMGGQCIGLELDLDHFLESVQTTFKLQSIGDGKALAVVKGVKDKGAVDICCRSFAGKCLGRNSEWNSRPTEFSFQSPREKALSFKKLGEEQQSSLLEGGTDVLVVTGILPGLASSDREEETVYNGEAEIKSDDIGKVEEPFMRNNVTAEQDQDEIESDDTDEFYKEALIRNNIKEKNGGAEIESDDSGKVKEALMRLEAKVDTDDPLMPKIVRPSNLRAPLKHNAFVLVQSAVLESLNKNNAKEGQAEVRSNNFQKAELKEVKSSLSMSNVKEERGQADIECDNSGGFYNKESIRNNLMEDSGQVEVKSEDFGKIKRVRTSMMRRSIEEEENDQAEIRSNDARQVIEALMRNSVKKENSQAKTKRDNTQEVVEALRDNLEESCQDEVDMDDSVMPQIVRPSKRNNAMGERGQVEFKSDKFGNIKVGSASTRNTVELRPRKTEGNDDYSDVQHYNHQRQHQIHHLTRQRHQHYDQHHHQIHHHHHTHHHQHTHHHHHQYGIIHIFLFLCALVLIVYVFLL